VISSLQIYLTFDFENLKIEQFMCLQEQACKTINNLLTRYSKKFSKVAAIVCNLLTNILFIKINNYSNLFLFVKLKVIFP